MSIDLEALLAQLVAQLQRVDRFADVHGELTREHRAGRGQLLVTFIWSGEQRVFMCHVQREAPIHTMARSLAADIVRSVSQRVYEGIGDGLQPNDVYYPSALGNTPTEIPGQPSGSAAI